MLDLLLAVVHHLLVFALLAVLAAELVLVRPGLTAETLRRVAAIDLWYGLLAAGVLAAGILRAVFAAKGWDYYSHNLFFWAKIAAFVLVGALSVPPTIAFIRWRRAGGDPAAAAVQGVRRLLLAEAFAFALLPVFAALMARGYGAVG